MDFDRAVLDLSAAMAEQLKGQLSTMMAQAQARIGELERQVAELRARHQAVVEELLLERQARTAAEDEVATIHSAIAAQVEVAEAEHAAEQAAEAERERRWNDQVQALQLTLQQERQQHTELQQRLQTLRRAATDLFSPDLFSLDLPAGNTSEGSTGPAHPPRPMAVTAAD